MRKYHQGKYTLTRPEKYAGDPKNVVYRSSWEKKMFIWCENNPSVIAWGSEIHPIMYFSKVDGKMRRYYPDVWLVFRDTDGGQQKVIVEIKPAKECKPPRAPKNPKNVHSKAKYLKEAVTYQKNKDKWDAATDFAKKHGMRFVIMDEYSLGIKKRKKNGR